MPHPLNSPAYGATRLIRVLADLKLTNAKVVAPSVTERLAQLIDLPDSIRISNTHGRLSTLDVVSAPVAGQTAQGLFLQTQASIVDFIAKSFAKDRGAGRVRLPVVSQLPPEDASAGCEPYVQFYLAHQRQLELRVQGLQQQLRQFVSGLSPELAQLSALDKVLGDTLASYSRRTLAVVPALLSKRFAQMLEEHRNAPEQTAPGWPQRVEEYLEEMRGMLLAETETRLLPILGLVETIKEDNDSNE
jgi:Protein of unknown function (DUF3348)